MVFEKSLVPAEVFKNAIFGLVVEDDTLEPQHSKDDILIVATTITASAGDLVVMQTLETPGSPSRYDVMRINPDSDLHDNRGTHIPEGSYSIVGVVVDFHRP